MYIKDPVYTFMYTLIRRFWYFIHVTVPRKYSSNKKNVDDKYKLQVPKNICCEIITQLKGRFLRENFTSKDVFQLSSCTTKVAKYPIFKQNWEVLITIDNRGYIFFFLIKHEMKSGKLWDDPSSLTKRDEVGSHLKPNYLIPKITPLCKV